jgi:hypothetical protein
MVQRGPASPRRGRISRYLAPAAFLGVLAAILVVLPGELLPTGRSTPATLRANRRQDRAGCRAASSVQSPHRSRQPPTRAALEPVVAPARPAPQAPAIPVLDGAKRPVVRLDRRPHRRQPDQARGPQPTAEADDAATRRSHQTAPLSPNERKPLHRAAWSDRRCIHTASHVRPRALTIARCDSGPPHNEDYRACAARGRRRRAAGPTFHAPDRREFPVRLDPNVWTNVRCGRNRRIWLLWKGGSGGGAAADAFRHPIEAQASAAPRVTTSRVQGGPATQS